MMSTRTLRYIHTTTQEVDSSFKVVTAHTTRQSTPGLYEKTSGKASGSLEQTHEVVQSLDDKITVVNSCLQEHGMDTATAVVPALVPPRSPRPPRKHSSQVHRIETSPYPLVGGLKETSGHHWQEKGGSLDSSEFGCPNESSMGYIEPHRLVLKQVVRKRRSLEFGAHTRKAWNITVVHRALALCHHLRVTLEVSTLLRLLSHPKIRFLFFHQCPPKPIFVHTGRIPGCYLALQQAHSSPYPPRPHPNPPFSCRPGQFPLDFDSVRDLPPCCSSPNRPLGATGLDFPRATTYLQIFYSTNHCHRSNERTSQSFYDFHLI
jgi:hypothetical protein